MNKLLTIVLITAMTQTGFGYVAQNGSLILGDQIQTNQLTFARATQRGIIMDTIMKNPDFAKDLNNIYDFLNIPAGSNLPAYEEIVDTLQISTNNSMAIAVIEAFEKAIMKHLHYNNYICCVEGSHINIFVTGIKYNWFYPSEWINPTSWTSSCNLTDLRQLMAELEQLANIASKHSIVTPLRLKTKIESYQNWKQNTLIIITALGTTGLLYKLKNQLFGN